MGLYRIKLKRGAADKIPEAMTSLGFPITRVEQRDNGRHYFYEEPKSHREFFFWTNEQGAEAFWLSGLSSCGRKIADGFSAAGLFVNERS
jgi:hypothetical protein